MSDHLPDQPNSLREKARGYRSAATTETKSGRRRAYILIASEYDQLADAIEKELGADPDAEGRIVHEVPSVRAPKGSVEP